MFLPPGSSSSRSVPSLVQDCRRPSQRVPNQKTDANGQFGETLLICAPACKSGGQCTTGCSTAARQTWTVNGVQLNNDIKALVYKCNAITVNGK
jgi:hypothetical protein